jgi:Uma2 family endonuclease
MAVAKPAGGWTYGDLFKLPNDGKRYEIIDGELFEMTAPSLIHQLVLTQLIRLLLAAVDAIGGTLVPGPVDVFMPGADPVEPDLLLLTPDNLHLQSVRGIEGPPDIVVEILSPSNPRHDRVRKRSVYARGGVKEYWLVSPENGTVEVLALTSGEYRTHVYARDEALVTSTVLSDVSFPVSAVFEPAAFLQG